MTAQTAPVAPRPHDGTNLADQKDMGVGYLDRSSAEREVQRLRATLAVQREVTAAAADRESAFRVVADRAFELFDAADGASVEILQGDELCALVTAGILTPYAGSRLPLAGSLSGLVLTTGRPAHAPDTATDGRVHDDTINRLGIRAMLVAPLHAAHRVIGCLKITSSRPGVFDDSDEQQLALLAASLSSALRHADDASRNLSLLVERTSALDALEAAERRFRLAFENSPLGLTLISLADDDYGRYLQANPAMTAITGYTAEELGRMTYHDLVDPDTLPDEEAVRSAIATAGGQPIRTELRYRHKDGHAVWVSLRAAPVLDDYGRPHYLVNQVEDVTAQREAQAQLRRQARLLELIPAAVIVRDLDGTIRWWNAGASALYGWPADAALGRISHHLLNTVFADPGGLEEQIAALTRDGHWAGALDHLTATGGTVTVVSRQVRHGQDQVLEINTDVTAARAAERALAESEQRFRAQFTHSATGQVVHSLDGTLGAVNPAFAAMLGRTVEDLTGRSYREFMDPDDLAASERHIAGLFAGESEAFSSEGRVRHADGHWVDVAVTISMVRDTAGRPLHLIGMITDISDRRTAERARDQAAAALTDRNARLEAANQLKLDIIGMLGHEIGNPLSSIRGYTEVLTEDWDDLTAERRERAVSAIARQARRMDEIVHEVLAMVTIEAGSVHAARLPLSVRDEIRRALVAADEEQLPVTGPDARVLFNTGHLQQILINLLSNAAKYGGGATGITVTADQDRVSVRVEDRGPGVPEEFRHRLFERLARADRDAASVRGTGLGLYIVRGLAVANHGDIAYQPHPDGGSVFVLDLERAPA